MFQKSGGYKLQHITELLNHYGYIVLFVALTLELIAFPTPGETLMTYCGFLVFQGKLNWGISVIVATMGVISGITISYFISRTLGTPFFKKYGSYIHMGPDRLEKVSKGFEKYGNGLLIIAYFIPGIRHITGYFSGITKIPFKRFALNAYIGAFFWTGTFIFLGKVLGSNWEKFHSLIKKYLVIGGIILAVGLICIYLYKKHKDQIIDFTIKSLENLIDIFHSLGKIKIAIAGVAIILIGLSIVIIGLIQDFLANEFSQFDAVTSYLVGLIFSENGYSIMKIFRFSTEPKVLIVMALLVFIWIMLKGKNRFLETRFLIITYLGGELLEELLRIIFHRLDPLALSIVGNPKYTFPSEQTFMAVVVYGFATFILLRHAKKRWAGTILAFITLVVCIATGISVVFISLQYPSDAAAGYAFGGVWLSLNIVLLEVFRVLPEIQHNKY